NVVAAGSYDEARASVTSYSDYENAAAKLISAYETGLNSSNISTIAKAARVFKSSMVSLGSPKGLTSSHCVYCYSLVTAWKYFNHIKAYIKDKNPFNINGSGYFVTTKLYGSGKTVVAKLKKTPTTLQLMGASGISYIAGNRSSLATETYTWTMYLKCGSTYIKAKATANTIGQYVTIIPSKSLTRGKTYVLCTSKSNSSSTWVRKGVYKFKAT
nr:hypothetical protein [Eubacterium sp.]